MSDNVGFSKYSSLTNHNQSKAIQSIRDMGLDDPEIYWIATEKAHGANFGFWFNMEEGIKLSSRNNFVNDSFMSAWKLDKYHEAVQKTFEVLVKECLCSVKDTVVIYGEIIGGIFFGDKEADSITVQKEVQYTPSTEFLAFDIKVIPFDKEQEEFYITPSQLVSFLDDKFILAPFIAAGSFDEIMKVSNEFNSHIPSLFNLDDEGRVNTCEGIVITPYNESYKFFNGKRVVIKSKNDKFSENNGKVKKVKEEVILSDLAKEYHEHMSTYITTNRFSNVCSHLHRDEVTFKNFNSLSGRLFKDMYDEFDQDVSKIVGKSQWKEMSRSLMDICREVTREYLKTNQEL